MEGLTVPPPLHRIHEDVLRGHEGELLQHVLFNDLGVDHQVGGHVLIEVQNGIGGQESLRHGDALVGRVVQGALKPLQAGGHGRVEPVGDDVPGQGADALAAHGVALVGHGGGSHLVGLKGLLHFLHVAQQPQVGGKFMGRLGNPRQGGQNGRVHFAGIGLAGDGLNLVGGKAHFPGNSPVQLPHLLLVPLKQLQEAGLGAGGALTAQKPQMGQAVLQLLQVLEELIHPQGGPLAHGDQLGGLIVGIAQGGQGLVLAGKPAQGRQDPHQFVPEEGQTLFHQNDIRVVPHVAAGGPQVEDGHGTGALGAVGVDVGHHVMAELPLLLLGQVIVDVVLLPLQLVDLPLGDGQAQFLLRPGQGNPQPAPGGEFFIGRKNIQHLPAGVAGGQGAFIGVFHGDHSSFLCVDCCNGSLEPGYFITKQAGKQSPFPRPAAVLY